MSNPESAATAFVHTGTEFVFEGATNPENPGIAALPAAVAPGAPEQIGEGLVNVSKEGPNTNIHSKIWARPLSTGAEKKFTRTPAFIYNPGKRDVGFDGEYTLMTLDQVNWSMRQAAFYQAMDVADLTRKRKHTDDRSLFESFPRTIDEFMRDFTYIGWVYGERYETEYASLLVSPENSMFNICFKGEVHDVVNYWTGKQLKIGDTVGFRVVTESLGDYEDRDWDGTPTGLSRMSRNTPVIQVVPWHDEEMGALPLGGDFVEAPREVKQVNGKIVRVSLYQPARTILVGHVQRTKRVVKEEEAKEALVSQGGVEYMLRSYKTVDLILMPQGSSVVV